MSVHAWCRDIERDEAVRAAEDGRSGPLPTLEEAIADPFTKTARIRETETAVEPAIPAADAQGGGVAGLRTERVTLEVTHDVAGYPLASWDWRDILRCARYHRDVCESVRVVEEVAIDAQWAERITDERDAAIRERDELRRALLVENDHALRIKDERDAAEAANASWCKAAGIMNARVAELESQLESAPAASGNSSEILTSSPAASGAAGMDVAEIARLAFDAGWGSSRDGFNAECAFDHLAPKGSTFEGKGGEPYEKLKRDSVAKIMSEAASGAAGTVPVAWGILRGGHFIVATVNKSAATESCKDHGGTVVALYAAPQPAKGWLTEKDREWLTYLLQNFPVSSAVNEWIHSLLARSTPPEVVLPRVYCYGGDGEPLVDLEDVRAALAAAGVTVKEVK